MSRILEILEFGKSHLFFYMCDHLQGPFLTVTFVFANAFEVLSGSHLGHVMLVTSVPASHDTDDIVSDAILFIKSK